MHFLSNGITESVGLGVCQILLTHAPLNSLKLEM